MIHSQVLHCFCPMTVSRADALRVFECTRQTQHSILVSLYLLIHLPVVCRRMIAATRRRLYDRLMFEYTHPSQDSRSKLIVQSSDPLGSLLSFANNSSDQTAAEWPVNVRTHSPESTFQIRINRSADALTNWLLASNSVERTACECSVNVRIDSPESAFQIFMEESNDPLASLFLTITVGCCVLLAYRILSCII